ncbi:hypothetical protein DSO57_1029216 [Entomophthora muscae]|uniref:Uncharacterized protein n=1 Tax=Entomophthora muscae TaxID=34485 RepID=A0ACC2UAT7_9FUNG|nr:hypothetical protein DSO57_1029216 [Entomophthora muscae]
MPLSEEAIGRYKEVLEKYPLTQVEKEIVNKSFEQLRTKSFGFVGAQCGFVVGAYSTRSAIREFPDQEKLRNLYRELTKIAAEEREKNSSGLPILKPPRGNHPTPQTSSTPIAIPSKENQDDLDSLFDEEKEDPSHDGSAWDRIRQAGTGQQSTWDKVRRGENSLSRQDVTSDRTSKWDSVQPSDVDTLFQDHTSESKTERKPQGGATVKRNKYGDIIELSDESLIDTSRVK